MGFLSFIVKWFDSLTGNFGIAVVLSVLFFTLLTIPCKLWSAKISAAKRKCMPGLAAIRKKYNANQLGVAQEDTPDMPDEVKRMSHDERSEAMANEISALYKENHYHMGVAVIPTVLHFAIIVLAYAAIRAASPEGFWTLNLGAIRAAGSYSENRVYFYILAAMMVCALLSPIFTAIWDSSQAKKAGKPVKSILIGAGISAALTLGIAIWIAVSVTTAIALAISTFYLVSFASTVFDKIRHQQTPAEAEEASLA